MKKLAALALAVALLGMAALPAAAWADRGSGHGGHGSRHGGHGFHGHGRFAHAHGFRSRVFIGVGPVFPVFPYYYYPPPYYAYPPPPVVVQEPPVYVQQPQPQLQSDVTVQPEAYWYYCQSAKAYYPNAQTCPEAWIKVPPRTQ